jgi:uncharacterized membrane protein
LRSTFTRPSAETLRIVLAAAAGGTATILGLVLSISLISWQATADRYRSTSIVAFLLRERLGSAVMRLLALGFAYSLCEPLRELWRRFSLSGLSSSCLLVFDGRCRSQLPCSRWWLYQSTH